MSFIGSRFDNTFFGFGNAPQASDSDFFAADRVNRSMRPMKKVVTLINAGLSGYQGYGIAIAGAAVAGAPVTVPMIVGAVVGRAVLGAVTTYGLMSIMQESTVSILCRKAEHDSFTAQMARAASAQ